MFALLRAGHDALFHLAKPDGDYFSNRIAELDQKIHTRGGISVGLHVRRGDRHPMEFQYQNSYIPFETYTNAAHRMIMSTLAPTNTSSDDYDAITASKMILASDDPDVYNAPEMQQAVRAQAQILLASGSTLDAARGSSATASPHKFVEGNVGWEGGFFSNVFWGLGGATTADPPPNEMTLQLRELVGRAYLLDLKVVGSSDRVVCSVSSFGCRLLAVMMGWERAIVQGKWKNVDGGFGWRGLD